MNRHRGIHARATKLAQAYDYDYLIVGSGFGGSVSALRLSEKGYSVGVLEMGKRMVAADFPRTNWNIRRYLWMPKFLCYGIQQITLLRDVLIFHGAGVGGGSLVYANTLLVPPKAAFDDPRWPGAQDWRVKLSPFYDLAKWMLGAVEAKEVYPSDEILRQIVDEEMGRGATFHRHTVGVFYGDQPGRTVPDPFFGGEGPERTGCITCGECMTGCRYNAKNTLDKNYLYLAEKRGAVIHPETRVTDVRPLPEGGYEVHTEQSTALFFKPKRVLCARGVVFSAGVLGTVRLLFDCKERGSLPRLSDRLGDYVRTNSEALVGVTARNDDVDYSRGIAITSGVHPDENTHIEVVRYGKGHDFMALMTTVLTGGGPPWPRWMRWVGNIVRHPVQFMRTLNPFGWAKRSAILLVMQPVDSHLSLRRGIAPLGGGLTSRTTEGPAPPTFIPLANRITERLAEKMKGTPQSILPEVVLNTCSTAHILGGATMGTTPAEGVCDPTGRIFGYENLFVADGSIVPANLGVNPSLTITALSEFVMSTVPPREGAEPKPAPRPAVLGEPALSPS